MSAENEREAKPKAVVTPLGFERAVGVEARRSPELPPTHDRPNELNPRSVTSRWEPPWNQKTYGDHDFFLDLNVTNYWAEIRNIQRHLRTSGHVYAWPASGYGWPDEEWLSIFTARLFGAVTGTRSYK